MVVPVIISVWLAGILNKPLKVGDPALIVNVGPEKITIVGHAVQDWPKAVELANTHKIPRIKYFK